MSPANTGERAGPKGKEELITVFITGNELGTMKPCGCSGGQLGGLIKRGEVLRLAQKARRVIIDTGGLVDGESEQDLIKFNIIIRALGLLDYDIANLTGKDFEIARNLGVIDNVDSDLKLVVPADIADANVPHKFSKQMVLKGKPVRVMIASFDARSGPVEHIERLFAPEPDVQTVKILILAGCRTDRMDEFVEKVPFLDCVICTDSAETPEIIGDSERRPLVVTSGQFGKYVGRLQIRTPKKTGGPLKLSFSAVPVAEELSEQEALAELYQTYQQIVRAAQVMENIPRFALPGGLEYMGSESCKTCHKYAYEKWKEQGHADAYSTLEEAGSDYDPECVVCHVVGLKYESGFISPEKTPEFRDVGCESCHGPGSAHVLTVGEEPTGEPKTTCLDCHTSENSVHYAGNEAEYFEKIVHWTEPNAASSVK